MNKQAIEKIYRSFFANGRITYINKEYYCVECSNGTKHWRLNGKLHRTDGPAIEWHYGDKEWYLNDKLHRTDGPAVECSDGTKEWWIDDKRHRTDGPAIEWSNGDKEWWIDGEYYTEQEYKELMKCGY